jgi:hypothetical protein
MERIKSFGVVTWLLVAFLQSSCVYYPTVRTFYQPNSDDGKILSTGCDYLTTHNTIERQINGATVTISLGDSDLATTHAETVDVHIRAIYEGADISIDPALVSVSADGVGLEIHGFLLSPIVTKIERGYQKKAGRVWQSISVDIRYPSPAGRYEALSLKFGSGAIRLSGEVQDVPPFRFSRVTKHDVLYRSINC